MRKNALLLDTYAMDDFLNNVRVDFGNIINKRPLRVNRFVSGPAHNLK